MRDLFDHLVGMVLAEGATHLAIANDYRVFQRAHRCTARQVQDRAQFADVVAGFRVCANTS